MTLMLYNSMSRRRERFKTIERGKVRLYVCGITPYDTTHVGHAFTYVSFDALVRYLAFRGFRVAYTQNVTDIDDDILLRARKSGKSWKDLGAFWTAVFLRDMKRLNVTMPTHYVKATDSVPRIIGIVAVLLERGIAYRSGGNVYFSVKRFGAYGQLSHFNYDQMKLLLKERGGDPDDPNKRYPLDFILWQRSGKGEPRWSTPFGEGRPGWHIECSAMVNEFLGDRIDIHGGGRDLAFPHHESEIAQSESYTRRRPFAKFFMHTGMTMYLGEKMAKSLGNIVMIKELLRNYSPNAIRWMLLSHHYRDAWEYNAEEADLASETVRTVERRIRASKRNGRPNGRIVGKFVSLMDDDLDTPGALRLISDDCSRSGATARYLMRVLGFLV